MTEFCCCWPAGHCLEWHAGSMMLTVDVAVVVAAAAVVVVVAAGLAVEIVISETAAATMLRHRPRQ